LGPKTGITRFGGEISTRGEKCFVRGGNRAGNPDTDTLRGGSHNTFSAPTKIEARFNRALGGTTPRGTPSRLRPAKSGRGKAGGGWRVGSVWLRQFQGVGPKSGAWVKGGNGKPRGSLAPAYGFRRGKEFRGNFAAGGRLHHGYGGRAVPRGAPGYCRASSSRSGDGRGGDVSSARAGCQADGLHGRAAGLWRGEPCGGHPAFLRRGARKNSSSRFPAGGQARPCQKGWSGAAGSLRGSAGQW